MYIVKPRPDEVLQQKADKEIDGEPKSKKEFLLETFEKMLYKAIVEFLKDKLIDQKFETIESINETLWKQWPSFVIEKSNYSNPDFLVFLMHRSLLITESGKIFSGYKDPVLIGTAVLENDNEVLTKTAHQNQ